MGLFKKTYHPLDSRHPRNAAGAQKGTYGVTAAPTAPALDDHLALKTAEKSPKKRPTSLGFSRKKALPPTSSPAPKGLSTRDHIAFLAAQTQARRAEMANIEPPKAQDVVQSQPYAQQNLQNDSQVSASKAPPASPLGAIGKGLHIAGNIMMRVRLITVAVFALYWLFSYLDLGGLATTLQNSTPKMSAPASSYSSDF
ncbi:hypothetical protein EDD53_0360 [Pacificibacter maritimus]|uniref:Uncharacterized protein n=1 Tax=Pacificibacter maritimus TaxID=762213 RepID=A0A3N4URF9_9RHOB|nr:hypothetical protein [Pacificibacter maritimus]RPE71245.1 hypothetical protein EDD53_0360 [Pacificibacter maritimus]